MAVVLLLEIVVLFEEQKRPIDPLLVLNFDLQFRFWKWKKPCDLYFSMVMSIFSLQIIVIIVTKIFGFDAIIIIIVPKFRNIAILGQNFGAIMIIIASNEKFLLQ